MSSYKSTIIVTGGTTGLGLECATELAKQRPENQIIIASRSSADDAAGAINRRLSQSNVSYLPLDLSSLANIRAFVSNYSAKSYPPLTALVMNAGLQFPGTVSYTPEGVEKTFAINHVGHALLFFLLQPHLTPDARLVITASGTHDPAQKTGLPDAKYDSAEILAHPTAESAQYEGRQRYATSKLCNVMWTYALDRHSRAASKQWTVNAFDPGLMPGTGLARDSPWLVRFVWHSILPRLIPLLRRVLSPNVHTPQESGFALAWLAADGDLKGVSGKYFEGLKEIKSSELSYVVEKQEELWEWTAGFVAGDEGEARAFRELA